MEGLGAHLPKVVGVEVGQLFDVEDGGGLGDAGDVEGIHQFGKGEDLLLAALALGGPAQQGHVV